MKKKIFPGSTGFIGFLVGLCVIPACFPAYAADTTTVHGNNLVNFTPWRAPISPGRQVNDPHPDTAVPETMGGTEADTQFGRNTVSGFSDASFDLTTSSAVGDFQSVINRINTSGSGSTRVNQLQTQINQNQYQGGYTFNNKFSVTSMTDSAGNLIGQANGNFIQTRQDLLPGGTVQTTTCVGTFATQPVLDPVTGKQMFDSRGSALMNYTLTSGTATGQNAGCTTK